MTTQPINQEDTVTTSKTTYTDDDIWGPEDPAPAVTSAEHTCCYHVEAARFVCAERERELLELKGPCSNKKCRLHYAHSGPCDTIRKD